MQRRDQLMGTFRGFSSEQELEKFEQLASLWWDEQGAFKHVHRFNRARLIPILSGVCEHFSLPFDLGTPDKVQAALDAGNTPLEGLRVLDIGCGGGLLSEPLARLGADVVAVDASANSISIAKARAQQQGLAIDYRQALAESLLGSELRFDVVINAEVIEHVVAQQALVDCCAGLLTPQGLLVMATLNRSWLSYLIAIVGAEYVLGWLPKGTHQWRSFVTPGELEQMMLANQLSATHWLGLRYSLLSRCWRESRSLAVNYMVLATPDQR